MSFKCHTLQPCYEISYHLRLFRYRDVKDKPRLDETDLTAFIIAELQGNYLV